MEALWSQFENIMAKGSAEEAGTETFGQEEDELVAPDDLNGQAKESQG